MLIIWGILLAGLVAISLGYRFSARVRAAWWNAMAIVAAAGMNPAKAFKMAHSQSRGGVSIETIIYVFVALVLLYQLIPEIGSRNTEVQASENLSTMAKFGASLGEWLLPLFGVLALVFMLWRNRSARKT